MFCGPGPEIRIRPIWTANIPGLPSCFASLCFALLLVRFLEISLCFALLCFALLCFAWHHLEFFRNGMFYGHIQRILENFGIFNPRIYDFEYLSRFLGILITYFQVTFNCELFSVFQRVFNVWNLWIFFQNLAKIFSFWLHFAFRFWNLTLLCFVSTLGGKAATLNPNSELAPKNIP